MMRNLFLISVVISLITCKPKDQAVFEKEGIRFIIPAGWKLEEMDTLKNRQYYVMIRKERLDSTGTFFIVKWSDIKLDPILYLERFEDILTVNHEYYDFYIYVNTTKTNRNWYIKSKFNGINTVSFSYSVKAKGINHKGIFHTFNTAGKTICVGKFETESSEKVNKSDFDIIEKSFSIK